MLGGEEHVLRGAGSIQLGADSLLGGAFDFEYFLCTIFQKWLEQLGCYGESLREKVLVQIAKFLQSLIENQ